MALRMYLTDRDQKVINFIEKYGSITISQSQKMFYNTQKYGYDIARRRLKKLVDYKKIKVARDSTGNENVYYIDKKLSYHDLLVLDYYAEVISHGAHIFYFNTGQRWLGGKIISDAYCCYAIGSRVFFNIVEVVRTHGVDKEKYLKLFESGEAHKFNSLVYERIGGKSIHEFPRVIIVDNVYHKNKVFIHDEVGVHQIDFKMGGFTEILL